ncbi:MAG: plasmid pRiA4b ORF-3 family protein [archaeon]|nr:plasmid pRiA4b ORF-3 family protein [archaeon]
MSHYRVKVKLKDIKGTISREFIVPSGITFEGLEKTINIFFGWSGEHLSTFEIKGERFSIISSRFPDRPFWGRYAYSDAVCLKEYKDRKLTYTYNLGDCWRHDVEVVEELEGDIDLPRLLKARGSDYLEDCGGPFAYDNSTLEKYSFDDEEMEIYNGFIAAEWDDSLANPRIRQIPYDAVYSVGIALTLPRDVPLYIDTATGAVYSTVVNTYFPVAEDITQFLPIDEDYRFELGTEFRNYLLKEELLDSDSSDEFYNDPRELYSRLYEEDRFSSGILCDYLANYAANVLEEMEFEIGSEHYYENGLFRSPNVSPISSILSEHKCPCCGNTLSNPNVDSNEEYRKYGNFQIRPVKMTCIGCGKIQKIVPAGIMNDFTYEGFRSPMYFLQHLISDLYENPGDARNVAEIAYYLMLYGDRLKACEYTESVSGSSDAGAVALASAVRYICGMPDAESLQVVKENIRELDSFNEDIKATLAALCTTTNIDHPFDAALHTYLDTNEETYEYSLNIYLISTILPGTHHVQKQLSEILLNISNRLGGFWKWFFFESYCRSMIVQKRCGEIQLDTIKEKDLDQYSEYGILFRYRKATLLSARGGNSAEKELKRTLTEMFNFSKKNPETKFRLAYAAILVHHCGIRYKNKDLLSLSLKWVSETKDTGFIGEKDVEEFFKTFFEVALADRSHEDVKKIVKRYKFDVKVPDETPEVFQPSSVGNLLSQYRAYYEY